MQFDLTQPRHQHHGMQGSSLLLV